MITIKDLEEEDWLDRNTFPSVFSIRKAGIYGYEKFVNEDRYILYLNEDHIVIHKQYKGDGSQGETQIYVGNCPSRRALLFLQDWLGIKKPNYCDYCSTPIIGEYETYWGKKYHVRCLTDSTD